METDDTLSPKQTALLADLCKTLNEASWELVSGINEKLTEQHLRELTLMSLGAQFRGGRNNDIGSDAEHHVFEVIGLTLAPAKPKIRESIIQIQNKAGHLITIESGSDPDVRIVEEVSFGNSKNLVSIEIKGGTDVSNLHNRIGEAEKTHLKAKSKGFKHFWTILEFKGFDLEGASVESPTTEEFFNIAEIDEPLTEHGKRFQELLLSTLGL